MKLIQKILNSEEVAYTSNLNEESLKQKINELYGQKTFYVAGKITSKDAFTVYDQWNVISWDMPNTNKKAAYLYGEIKKSEAGTLVKLKVKPNAVLPVFAIISFFIGVLLTLNVLLNKGHDKFLFFIGLVFVSFGIIYYPLSSFLKNRLRNKTVKYLDLKKV